MWSALRKNSLNFLTAKKKWAVQNTLFPPKSSLCGELVFVSSYTSAKLSSKNSPKWKFPLLPCSFDSPGESKRDGNSAGSTLSPLCTGCVARHSTGHSPNSLWWFLSPSFYYVFRMSLCIQLEICCVASVKTLSCMARTHKIYSEKLIILWKWTEGQERIPDRVTCLSDGSYNDEKSFIP